MTQLNENVQSALSFVKTELNANLRPALIPLKWDLERCQQEIHYHNQSYLQPMIEAMELAIAILEGCSTEAGERE